MVGIAVRASLLIEKASLKFAVSDMRCQWRRRLVQVTPGRTEQTFSGQGTGEILTGGRVVVWLMAGVRPLSGAARLHVQDWYPRGRYRRE